LNKERGIKMALKSKIEWTENTWNPVTGCTKISDGCQNCYAYRMAKRLQRMGNKKYVNGFKVTLHKNCLTEPLNWNKPSLIFVNSMSDLFHEEVPIGFIKQVFDIMNQATWHTFQILTKRAERLVSISEQLNWSPNIWQGVTVESEKYKSRIELLKRVPARIRFISFEPLIGDIGSINLSNIDWVIVGGESGFNCRKIEEDWILNIKNQCEQQKVYFYFKQWGGTNKKKNGRRLLGKTWDDMPEINLFEHTDI